MPGKRRQTTGQVKKTTRADSMSNEDTRMAMPLDNTHSTQGSGGTMRRFMNGLRWVSGMILMPVDYVITFLFFVELRTYRYIAGRLPNLRMLSSQDQSNRSDEVTRMNDRIRKMSTDLSNSEMQRKDLEEDYNEFIKRSNDEKGYYEHRIREMNTKLNEVEKEKEDALRRLSEIISVKLRDNNPNIVDLNDQCRPTKLAEMFSELYDNEWTNAFGVLDRTFTEKQSIVILLDIVMEAYEFCSVVVNGTWENLEMWFFDNKVKASSEQQKVTKWLKDNRKAIIKRKGPETTKLFMEKVRAMCGDEQIQPLLSNEYVAEYFTKCIELCLLMTANDPPVVIVCPDWKPCRRRSNGTAQSLNESNDTSGSDGEIIQPSTNEPKSGKKFNKDLFKEYTKRGKFMEYIVWPVMFLHEGGSTLSKGVAQGTNDLDISDNYTWRSNT